MNILISGGSGFIGQALVDRLLDDGHKITVISRRDRVNTQLKRSRYDSLGWFLWQEDDQEQLTRFERLAPQDVVINLAGEGIADKPWSEKRKQQLLDSRVGFTRKLIALIDEQKWRPSLWLNGSAIGFYGSGDQKVSEQDANGNDFAARLCREWEDECQRVKDWSCRLVIMRLGVVLGPGGMLRRLKPSFYCGMGAVLGHGQQGFSWIHMKDLLDAMIFLLETPDQEGIYNLTSPEPVSNEVFTKGLAGSLNRPAWLTMPSFMMRLILGEMADTLLLSGQWVVPQRLEQAGFRFTYPEINTALKDLMG